jgi:Avidin family
VATRQGARAVRPQPRPSFSGTWRNELGSIMRLRVSGSVVSGRYASHVSTQRRPVSGPITGYVHGFVIGWVVQWPRSQETGKASITSWAGQYVRERGKPVIQTLWFLTEEVDPLENPKALWDSVNAGADRFVRV